MKVNITGKGIIPGIGTLAPKYNVEMTKEQIERIFNFPHYHQLVVVDVASNLVVTDKNINTFFEKKKPVEPKIIEQKPIVEKKKPAEKKVEQPKLTIEQFQVDPIPEPLPEIEEPDIVVQVSSVSEKIGNVFEVEKEEYVEPELTVEITSEEIENESNEETTHQTYTKKKKRRR